MIPQNEMLVKMVSVDAETFEAVGYVIKGKQLYIKFRTSQPLVFHNVPGFRYDGLLAAPRKDAYFETFIKNFFVSKPAELSRMA
ncbi:MAG: KTSC domain-containing protein [Limisphaerales bacterium]